MLKYLKIYLTKQLFEISFVFIYVDIIGGSVCGSLPPPSGLIRSHNNKNHKPQKMNKIKLTTKELDKTFPMSLLTQLQPEELMNVQMFQIKALTIGVTSDEIDDVIKFVLN